MSEGQRSPEEKWPHPEGLRLTGGHTALRSVYLEQPNLALRALFGPL